MRGTWVAQSVERPTPAQVMISRLVGLSPTSCSGAWNLFQILCSVSVSKINFKKALNKGMNNEKSILNK